LSSASQKTARQPWGVLRRPLSHSRRADHRKHPSAIRQPDTFTP
jgi:hypothetical protein